MSARPAFRHTPSPATRRIVKAAASWGGSEVLICAVIAAHLGKEAFSRQVLRRHYEKELATGRKEKLWRVESTVYARACGEDGAPADMQTARWYLERQDRKKWGPGPQQVEIGRPNDFAHLSGDELAAEIRRLEAIVHPERARAGTLLSAPGVVALTEDDPGAGVKAEPEPAGVMIDGVVLPAK